MKQLIFFFSFLLLSGSVFATQSSRTLESFDDLRVSESITVNLLKNNKNSAEVSVQSGDAEDLITEVSGGVLRIYWKKGKGYNRTAEVNLNYTKLAAISVSAGAKVISNEILESKDLELDASSGGRIQLNIACTNLTSDVSSGSAISLSGTTKNQSVDASSGASYKCKELISEMTNAEASSGASVAVHASNTINAEASSGASIKYKGNPPNKEIEASDITGGRISSF